MSVISNRQAFSEDLLEDIAALSGFIANTVQRLHRVAATEYRSEIDMSTLRVSINRDSLGLSLKASALELVTVGSRWIRSGAPVSRQGPFKVLTIDHRVDQTYPWITVEDGWAGRLDYFHREYTRYADPELPKSGSYWIMTEALNVGTKWRCLTAAPSRVEMVATDERVPRWYGTVAEFNQSFRRSTD